jgi:hypothetical protein
MRFLWNIQVRNTIFSQAETACNNEIAGWLYDESAPDMKGKQSVGIHPPPLPASAFNMGIRFDSSIGRGDLITPIGVGRVIPGAQSHLSHARTLWR